MAPRTLLRYALQPIKVRLHYRLDLLLLVLGDVGLAAVGLIFLGSLFGHIDTLGSWSGAEVLFCWGFAEAVVGTFFFLFQGLYSVNQRYILGGELDRVLLRPLDPLLQILLDNLGFEQLSILLLGCGVMAWVAPELAIAPWRWALLPLLVLGATGVVGGVLIALSSMGFYLHHRGTAVGLVFQLSTFNRYPMDLFGRPLRYALTFVLPLGFAGFYPATFFLGRPEWTPYALATPLVGVICMVAGVHLWRRGLARYTSSGS